MQGVLAVIGVGALATTSSILAAKWSWQSKARQGLSSKATPLLAFWITVACYMAAFTALRLAYLLDLNVLPALFYAQTFAGAMTIVSLSYIMVGIIAGPRVARYASEVALAAAVMVVTIIFTEGLTAPSRNAWGIEFLPANRFVRLAIAVVYVALPVAMSTLAAIISHRGAETGFDRRMILMAASVTLMFVPNAIRYVVLVDAALGVALAVAMMGGTMLGAMAYRPP